ncbi:DUF2232 domain-containing protein [Roseococcus suduntuyensis]|uniref:DUF2232 domain-containing protein n=1 Tax=Roseococcus suduntuyensis TaxID=455361 RepID=A0A840AAN7_9PROT|nr:DUF2232 domain-containing protein [Roseococcus suduntuyensis]MBB3897583.1 hypothetical protein [Roseococcus suduntuyensis]
MFSQPWALAAGAAGLLSALFALFAMRGMPFGGLLMWVAPLPILAAGAAFGGRVAGAATGLAAAVVLLGSSLLGMGMYLVMFGLPAALIAITALPPGKGRMVLSTPLALLGLWPTAVLLLVALFVTDLEGAMRSAVEMGVARMGVDMPEAMMDQVARVKAAAAGLWLALLLLGNGLLAQRFVERRGLALAALPPVDDLRLPGWYAPLPLVALVLWTVSDGVLALSALLLLLLPFFLLGVLGVHRRLRNRPGRRAFLTGFYLLMLLFLQLMAPLMVGVGLFDQFRRRPAPPNP